MAKDGGYDAIITTLNIINGRVESLDKKVDHLRDELAATRGDTRGTDECKGCRTEIDTALADKVSRGELKRYGEFMLAVVAVVWPLTWWAVTTVVSNWQASGRLF